MKSKMKLLTCHEANARLNSIGMEIGGWNQITTIDSAYGGSDNWINYQAPENARELFNFSEHVAGWLPDGGWIIFQIDNLPNKAD